MPLLVCKDSVIASQSAAETPTAGMTSGPTVNVGTFVEMETSAPESARAFTVGTFQFRTTVSVILFELSSQVAVDANGKVDDALALTGSTVKLRSDDDSDVKPGRVTRKTSPVLRPEQDTKLVKVKCVACTTRLFKEANYVSKHVGIHFGSILSFYGFITLTCV